MFRICIFMSLLILVGCESNERVTYPDFAEKCYSVDSAIILENGLGIVENNGRYTIDKITFEEDQNVIGTNHFILTGGGLYDEVFGDYLLSAIIYGHEFLIYRNELAKLKDFSFIEGDIESNIDSIKDVVCRSNK